MSSLSSAELASRSQRQVRSAIFTLPSQSMMTRNLPWPEVSLNGETSLVFFIAPRMARSPGTMRTVKRRCPMVFQNACKHIRLLCAMSSPADVVKFCENENSGDLVLLGWNWDGSSWSFAPERGGHAGPGPEETQGFLVVPPGTKLPPGATNFVRPAALRDAALGSARTQAACLHRSSLRRIPSRLRVMSYNVHSCIGMDGRISPRAHCPRHCRAIA